MLLEYVYTNRYLYCAYDQMPEMTPALRRPSSKIDKEGDSDLEVGVEAASHQPDREGRRPGKTDVVQEEGAWSTQGSVHISSGAITAFCRILRVHISPLTHLGSKRPEKTQK